MKLGISTYSLYNAYSSGQLTIKQVIEKIAEFGAEHVEIVAHGYNLTNEPNLIEEIKSTAEQCRITLSNYAITANFSDVGEEELEQELARVKVEIDNCQKLGIKKMRTDIGYSTDTSLVHFEAEFASFVKVLQILADYALQYDITLSIENHGYYVQHSERVNRLYLAVNRLNFKLTVDIGNFLCVGETSSVGVANTIAHASMVHVKDFYVREYMPASEGWFQATSGDWLRGSIFGQGDVDVMKALKLVKASGYDDFISLEFEGMEDCLISTRLGFQYLKQLWVSL